MYDARFNKWVDNDGFVFSLKDMGSLTNHEICIELANDRTIFKGLVDTTTWKGH
jgi:hypothetical protein